MYRIEPNGNPRRIWSHAQDVVYAIAFDGAGRAVLGTGNKGNVYRIESPTLWTALLTVPATQVTAFQAGREGRLYAATGNAGKVYEIGPGLEREGTIESDVFDAGMYSLWGRLSFEANLNGGQVAIAARSGNLDQPQKNWSPFSPPITETKGGRVGSPAARFVQWKATLTADGSGHSPELESVDLAYLPKNVEPRIEEIEMTPPNYKFPAPVTPLISTQQTLNLPPLGRRPAGGAPAISLDSTTTTPAMQLAKGYMGARWLASDPNGDSLIYTVEIRGASETEWKLLKDRVAEKYISWDSTAFPDGEYHLRITASDAPGNPPSEALTARMESDAFWIDNTPPKITGLAATRAGGKLEVRWHAADALNNIAKAEYSLDGGEWTVVAPVTKLSDSLDLDYDLTIDAGPGEHTIAVRVAGRVREPGDVFDAGMYSLWGRLSFEANLNGGQVAIATRSGNLDQPQKNWSPVLAAHHGDEGRPRGFAGGAVRAVESHAHRRWLGAFAGAGIGGPGVPAEERGAAHRRDRDDAAQLQVPGARDAAGFHAADAQSAAAGKTSGGRRAGDFARHHHHHAGHAVRQGVCGRALAGVGPQRRFADLHRGDPRRRRDGVEAAEGSGGGEVHLVGFHGLSGRRIPSAHHGVGRARNPPSEALTARMESDAFWIDNTPPKITGLAATRTGGKLEVRWHAADALNNITKAEYSLDGGEWTVVAPVTKLSDSLDLDYDLTIDAGPGEHTIAVRVEDDYENLASDKVVVGL